MNSRERPSTPPHSERAFMRRLFSSVAFSSPCASVNAGRYFPLLKSSHINVSNTTIMDAGIGGQNSTSAGTRTNAPGNAWWEAGQNGPIRRVKNAPLACSFRLTYCVGLRCRQLSHDGCQIAANSRTRREHESNRAHPFEQARHRP